MLADPRETWRRRGAWALDVVIALGLGALGASDGLHSGDFPYNGAATAALMGLAGAVLVLRRVLPLTSFTISLGAMTLIALLYGTYQSGASVLIAVVAVFSAASYGANLPYVIAVCFGFDAALSVSAPTAGVLPTVVFTTLLLAVVAAAGVGARRLRDLLTEARSQAAASGLRAEQERAEAATAERSRIARELHDILAHGLGVVVLQTGAADHALDFDPALARASVRAARSTAEQAIAQLETLVAVVREERPSATSPQPTISDVPSLAVDASMPGFEVRCDVRGDSSRAPAQIQASAYRIAQEGITNALKHSGGTTCSVSVDCTPVAVRVEVVDDGPGREGGAGLRMGLAGIQERVAVFGGRMTAGPAPAGGWALLAEIPVPA
ncbi:sensor histidine kinase [Longivirga aurantiaca]|uniref:histidine kinase n=1 Tax=Longivirga aurantiaca TaxID=1837743 RepID=A0ABW1SXT6_9ACTN